MELKPGYKQTVIGVIPKDWDLKSVGEIVSISVARDLKTENYSTYQDDVFIYPIFSNGVENEGLYGFYNVAEYYGDSLTIVGRGVGLGTAFKRSGGYGAIGRLLVLFPEKNIDTAFLTGYINHRLKIFSESGGIPQLTGISISKYKIPIPPSLTEQTIIAEALSDADVLIESLEQLISKKRQIKQGAMQELLTGKRCLLDSHEEWRVKQLGEIAYIKTGSRNNQDKVEEGVYPFFVRSKTIEKINSYSYDCEAILVPGEGGIGSIFHYIVGRFDIHQRVYCITQFQGACGKYIYFYITKHFGAYAMQNSVKATVDSLRLPTFQNFEITMPSLEEQTVIATILSDIDADISAQEIKLAKVRQIKQGMMHNLLTGRIRLL